MPAAPVSSPSPPSNPSNVSRWQDASAGLSIAGLLLPEAVAYAGIGNMAPQAGILALFIGLLCYGVLGTSRFAIVSATSSSAAVLAAAMASMPGGTAGHRLMLAAGLVLLTGAFFLLAAIEFVIGIFVTLVTPLTAILP